MAKLKVKIKNGQVTAIEKISGSKTFEIAEVALLASKLPRCFFRPSAGGYTKINYLGPVGVPLQRFLRRGVDQNTFFMIAAQMVGAIKKIDRYGLCLDHLVLDKKLVFINLATKELYFIYRLTENKKPVDVPEFVEEIMISTFFKHENDLNDASAFLSLVKRAKSLSADELEQYIGQFCPSALAQFSSSQSGSMKSGRLEVVQPKATIIGGQAVTGLEETSLLCEEEETTLLDVATVALEQMPSVLIRQKTGEEIMINKPVFRIGRESGYVDYCVNDNKAISRGHADIITKDGRYFILDHNSTNKTYINDVAIKANKEFEIFGGDRVELADEEFSFLGFTVDQRGRT